MWIDGAFAGLVTVGIVLGAWGRFSRQLAAYASLILGFALGLPLASALAGELGVSDPAGRALLFAASYAAIALACHLAAAAVRLGLESAKLQGYDRHMGGVFGGLQGFALSVVAVVVAANFHEDAAASIRERPSAQIAARAVAEVRGILPDPMAQALDPYLRKLDETPGPS
jgi:uncharacterized membrane protein required for colicin V production